MKIVYTKPVGFVMLLVGIHPTDIWICIIIRYIQMFRVTSILTVKTCKLPQMHNSRKSQCDISCNWMSCQNGNEHPTYCCAAQCGLIYTDKDKLKHTSSMKKHTFSFLCLEFWNTLFHIQSYDRPKFITSWCTQHYPPNGFSLAFTSYV